MAYRSYSHQSSSDPSLCYPVRYAGEYTRVDELLVLPWRFAITHNVVRIARTSEGCCWRRATSLLGPSVPETVVVGVPSGLE